jgi:hypothetical protein
MLVEIQRSISYHSFLQYHYKSELGCLENHIVGYCCRYQYIPHTDPLVHIALTMGHALQSPTEMA